MGVSFSCPLAAFGDLEDELQVAIVKSLSFEDDQQKKQVSSINFRSQEYKPKTLEALDSRKMLIEESGNERKEMVSPSPREVTVVKKPELTFLDSSHPKHEAAVKLQKVYKSFRTRRKLADCAVLIEQSWWKLLDFAELKHSSISFFDLDKHETAISRWSRARTRAAKVGKGLSKNGKAQKLALQHWLEAIDPRHRYGHNLHFYYVKWLHSQSKEPFFYWLDIGEGKEVNLVEKCPRSKLQQQCIKYLGPMERKAYEVVVEDGKLFYKQTGELLDTSVEPKAKWIFVLSTTRTLYVGKKKKGSFQHSSFLAGGAALAAGRIVVDKGILKVVWPHSGHYRPTPENFLDFISFLKENNVDINDVKLDSVDEEEESLKRANSSYLGSNSSEDDLGGKDGLDTEDNDVEDSNLERNNSINEAAADLSESKPLHLFVSKLTNLQIPSKDDLLERLQTENQSGQIENSISPPESPLDGYETAEELCASEEVGDSPRPNLSSDELDEAKEETASEESILERINSHKGTNIRQLREQLSRKWSTGAGPRIGCLRDYPSELQSHALEQVNLSPRSACSLRFNFSSCVSTPTSLNREVRLSPLRSSPKKGNMRPRTNHHLWMQCSPSCKGSSVASVTEA